MYPEYDPAKAQNLLRDYGKPVKVTLQVPAFPIGVLIGELYQSYWKKVGVETEIAQVRLDPPISAQSSPENTKRFFGIRRICPILTFRSMRSCIPAAGLTWVE